MRNKLRMFQMHRNTFYFFKPFGFYSPSNIVLFLTMFLLASSVAQAAGIKFENLPVIDPKPDFNGVDAGTGSFYSSSPITFNVPGAGHLNMTSGFNGRKPSYSALAYIEDKTYWSDQSSSAQISIRHITVHVGGLDRLFSCPSQGICTQDIRKDGSQLMRNSQHDYVFTDKNGTVYQFFPTMEHYYPEGQCTLLGGDPTYCNAAEYEAAAMVSTITYPSGEKITYSPISTTDVKGGQTYRVETITSNLGYALEIRWLEDYGYTVPSSSTTGDNWLRFYYRGQRDVDFALYKDATLLNTITTRYTEITEDPVSYLVVQSDDLGREYKVTFQGGFVMRCHGELPSGYNPPIDSTPMLPISVTSPGQIVTQINYHMENAASWEFVDAAGAGSTIPVSSIVRGGLTWKYDNAEESKILTDPNGKTRKVNFSWIQNDYDHGDPQCPEHEGNVETQIDDYTDELQRLTGYAYENNLIEGVSFPENNGYNYRYDSRGNITSILQVAKPGSAETDREVFSAGYPETCTYAKTCNQPSWTKDAKGNQTDYTYYNEHGGVATMTLPADADGVRPTKTHTYTATDTGNGTLWRLTHISECIQGSSCSGSQDELVTEISYLGNTLLPQTKTIRAGDGSDVATESTAYNNKGLVSSVRDALNHSTYYHYDVIGRQIGEISEDPDGGGSLPRLATKTNYDADDRVTSVLSGTTTGVSLNHLNAMSVVKQVVYGYDGLGRKNRETVSGGGKTYGVTQYSYDAWNRVVCTAQRLDTASVPEDACALGATAENAEDRITRNVYDAAGQLLNVYKAFGTPLEQVYKAYSYSNNGKPISITDANQNKAGLSYDGYDRQTHWYFPSKTKAANAYSNSDYEQYGYDANDNRISFRRRNGVVLNYEFDNLDRMVQKIVPARSGLAADHSQNVYYGYDLLGRTLYTRFGSDQGAGVTQSYNVRGDQTSASINLDGVTRTINYAPDAKGLRRSVTYPGNQVFSFNWDALDRLSSITHANAGTLASYRYKGNGLLDRLTGGGINQYQYDGMGRLTVLGLDVAGSASDNTYKYDYNAVSQLTKLQTTNSQYVPIPVLQKAAYNTNGLNQYTAVGGVNYSYDANGNLTSNSDTNYTYDQENRLVKATKASGELIAELWYDPLGRLYKYETPIGITYFLYDGDELIAEYINTSTTPLRRYVHGAGVDDPVVMFDGSSVTSSNLQHLHPNQQGSIVAVTDNSSNVESLLRYDAWGKPLSNHSLRFGYTGQVWLSELGLWHYKARMYSPTLGRFMQTDPVGYEDQMNLYAYVGNDPMNHIDPTGKFVIALPAIPWAAAAIKAALFTGSAAAVAYGASEAYNAYSESSEGSEGTRKLGDLEPIHDPDHPQNDPEIGELSDEGLGEAINNPEDGEKVKVRGNTVIDGNTRINEAKGRGWAGDTEIPVIEFPERPDNINDDPLGPYGG